jgi:hypothetical protein
VRHLFAVALLTLAIAPPAPSAPAPQESWGKPGVSFERYRQDSIECGVKGHYTDISRTEDAQAFVRASRQLDAVVGGGLATTTTSANATGPASTDSVDQAVRYAQTQQHIVANVRPEMRYRNIKRLLLSNTDQCLVDRGYSKFRLTDEQRHRLRKLKFGSEQRRGYLYSLASNPAVLQSQAVIARP